MARVAVKNHRHGALNPKVMLRRELSLEQVLSALMVAAPLTGYDCCPTSDGAACVLVVDADLASAFTDQPVYVTGWGAASDTLALHSRPSVTRLAAARWAAERAYRMAGVAPEQLDLAEVHDCFTVAELLAAGQFDLGGRLPVNVSGGLKAKGHPIEATGVGQAVELFHQLRGQAQTGARQLLGAATGLAYNMGGSGASATVHIFQQEVR